MPTSETVKPPEGFESWLDWTLRPNERWLSVTLSPDTLDTARLELAALRQRCADLEMMLRASFGFIDRPSRLFINCTDRFSLWDGTDYIELDDDGTGLPLLDDAARSALKGKKDSR